MKVAYVEANPTVNKEVPVFLKNSKSISIINYFDSFEQLIIIFAGNNNYLTYDLIILDFSSTRTLLIDKYIRVVNSMFFNNNIIIIHRMLEEDPLDINLDLNNITLFNANDKIDKFKSIFNKISKVKTREKIQN